MIRKNYKKRRLLRCAYAMGRQPVSSIRFEEWLDKVAPCDTKIKLEG